MTAVFQTLDDLVDETLPVVRSAVAEMRQVLACEGISEPSDPLTRLHFAERSASDFSLPSGWQPAGVFSYTSVDPHQAANPGVTRAVENLIDHAVAAARRLRATDDPTLTYLSAQRSRNGRRRTPITQVLAEIDPGFADWMDNLPAAERLRPVAHPGATGSTFVRDRAAGALVELPNTPLMSAMFIGGADGRAVREREAWEREAIRHFIDPARLPDRTLTMTSLGTGTGEPAMDTGIAVMLGEFPDDGRVVVHGYDVNADSLAIAVALAERKGSQLRRSDVVLFFPYDTNLLSAAGLRAAVTGARSQVYESIGFMEYVPSDFASQVMEREQRRVMERMGCISAESFYGEIYSSMPSGSVLLTGNMRDDSPQAPFVVDGLGWKGIIQRSTTEYLGILERAGVPGGAVTLCVPDPDGSAGVYNLVAIRKV